MSILIIFCIDGDPMKLDLVNVYLSSSDSSKPSLSIDQYTIHQTNNIGMMSRKNFKKHTKTGYLEFFGSQPDSVLFQGGTIGNQRCSRKRKFIEDILVIGSLLHGWNWELYSRRNDYRSFPLIPNPYSVVSVGLHEITTLPKLHLCL